MATRAHTDTDSHWDARRTLLEERVTQGIRTLLQEKHLYQHTLVDFDDIVDSPLPNERERIAELLRGNCGNAVNGPWDLRDNTGHFRKVATSHFSLHPRVPDVSLVCRCSNRRQPFNAVSAEDMLGRDPEKPAYDNDGQTIQIFALSFLCQSCKRVPEVVLVRRAGARLTLAGRSPIEHIEVPAFVPKAVSRFYRDALIAHQCGQTLSGLFMLRTLIEQWVRALGHNATRPSDAIDAYVASLPDDFRRRFPCLRQEYESLSDDLHCARGSDTLFQDIRRNLDNHFESMGVFIKTDPTSFPAMMPLTPPSPPPTQ